MRRGVSRFVYWAPRILSILFLFFLVLFSLDVFEICSGWDCMLGLLMHNIPVLILLIVLIISWRYEIVGGIAFILAGLVYIFFIMRSMSMSGFEWYYVDWILQISGIAFFIGILFLIGWYKKPRKN
jgi:hypothetical protein